MLLLYNYTDLISIIKKFDFTKHRKKYIYKKLNINTTNTHKTPLTKKQIKIYNLGLVLKILFITNPKNKKILSEKKS